MNEAQPTPVSEIDNLVNSIDWTDPNAKISKYFTVKEALYLPSWDRLANYELDGLDNRVKWSIIYFARYFMDPVREILGPIKVINWWRPEEYNKHIGGAHNSAHQIPANEFHVCAVDFTRVGATDPGIDCDDIKRILTPHLPAIGLRMEDNGKGAHWVHVDNRQIPQGGNRIFKP